MFIEKIEHCLRSPHLNIIIWTNFPQNVFYIAVDFHFVQMWRAFQFHCLLVWYVNARIFVFQLQDYDNLMMRTRNLTLNDCKWTWVTWKTYVYLHERCSRQTTKPTKVNNKTSNTKILWHQSEDCSFTFVASSRSKTSRVYSEQWNTTIASDWKKWSNLLTRNSWIQYSLASVDFQIVCCRRQSYLTHSK